jgi:hypothetical protein
MKAKKTGLLLILIVSISLGAHAQWGEEQMEEKPSFKDRMFFGGGFGLSFSSSYDYFSLSPIIGYKLGPKVATGLSIIYRYTNYKYVTPSVSMNDYGVSPFIRYQFYGPLFLHVEYEYLNYEYIAYTGETTRKNYTSLMAGGGFFQPIGRHAGLYISALYNFSYKNPTSPYDYYPYSSPLVIRAGITAGF